MSTQGWTMERAHYTPREVAEILAISDDAVLDLIRRGDLPALCFSPGIIRIPIAGFDLWRDGHLPARRQMTVRAGEIDIRIGADEELPEPDRSLVR